MSQPTGRVVPLNSDEHTQVQVQLPWYAAERLDDDEREQVDAHLAGCARCRAELDAERKLQAAHREIETPGDVESGWAAMRAAIAAAPAAKRTRAARRAPGVAPLLRWLVGVQFAAIVLLATLLLVAPPAERYRGLGAVPAPIAAHAIVKFRPETPEHELRRVLGDSGARVVDGPTASAAYLLQLPADRQAALERLRAEPAVLLAEALDRGEQ